MKKVDKMQLKQQEEGYYSIENLPKRPKLNTEIVKRLECNLVTNYYKLNFKQKKQKFYQYALSFDPEIPDNSRSVIWQAIQSIEKQLKKKIGYYIHRGNIIWGFKASEEILSFNTKFEDKKTKTLFAVTIQLKKTKQIKLSSLRDGFADSQKVIQVLNSELKKVLLLLGMVEFGKSGGFYLKSQIDKKIIENSDLQVWRGFHTSIHLICNEAYLLVDFTSRVLRKADLRQRMKKMTSDEAKDLIGKTVLCNYGNYKTYKIEGIQKKMTPLSKFQRDGKQITYKQYFKSKYNKQIKDDNQYLIKVFNKRKIRGQIKQHDQIYLVPELLKLTGITDDEIKNGLLMRDLGQITKLNPQKRMKENYKIIDIKQINSTQIFTIDIESSSMKGYLLNQPSIKLYEEEIQPQNGVMTVKTKLYDPMILQNFLVIATSKDKNDDDQVDLFIDTLKKSAITYGITIGKYTILTPKNSLFQSFKEEILKDKEKYGKPTMIITFLTNQQSKIYKDLKRLLYVDIGITHQNVLRKKFFGKNSMSIASKILLQINAKLGKPVWKVLKKHPDLENKKILIGGMAIYHKLVNRNKSCEAFVGNTNKDITSFYSAARLIPKLQQSQRLDSIESMVVEWLRQSCAVNKHIPDYIFFYRDGTGESQITSILNIELQAIKRGIKTVQEKLKINFKPEIALILCNKKIHQRIFQEQNKNPYGPSSRNSKSGRIINPSSGTILGEPISRYGFDFHLTAQYVNSGTCTPTHYNVIYNTINLTEEAFWYITFQQCFNYYNWQGAVRVPAPLMYANKLATLVGQHIQTQPNDKELSKKLYCL